jgi:hypothetical protein
MKRLKCTLHIGTDPEDVTTITIMNYDEIPRNKYNYFILLKILIK